MIGSEMQKSCDKCSHSLMVDELEEGQVLCIAKPPVPLMNTQGQIITVFPTMMIWGKCDAFIKGRTQKQNSQPPEILEPNLKVIR